MAKVRHLDRIVQIQEAASTAFLLGIKDRVDTTNVVQNNQLNITTTSNPLYYRGFRALNEEIEVLRKRVSDDHLHQMFARFAGEACPAGLHKS